MFDLYIHEAASINYQEHDKKVVLCQGVFYLQILYLIHFTKNFILNIQLYPSFAETLKAIFELFTEKKKNNKEIISRKNLRNVNFRNSRSFVNTPSKK